MLTQGSDSRIYVNFGDIEAIGNAGVEGTESQPRAHVNGIEIRSEAFQGF